MHALPGDQAFSQLAKNIRKKTYRFPYKGEPAFRFGGIFPKLEPKFAIAPGQKVFTIGSCFARNIEAKMLASGLDVPVAGFQLPEGEFKHPAPHILNEYNLGTMVQRFECAFDEFAYTPDMGIEETPRGLLDLFLHIHVEPVDEARLVERRKEIDTLYDELKKSDIVVITLGLVECWYDVQGGYYLNKAPSKAWVAKHPGRYEFRRMDVSDVVPKLERIVQLISSLGEKKILLTVSPVPVEATFMPDNCVVANSYSKSVLRVAADAVVRGNANVDYFPSYEIVLSHGASAFLSDNVHVDDGVVDKVTRFMIKNYAGLDEDNPDLAAIDLYFKGFEALNELYDSDLARKIAGIIDARFPGEWFGHDLRGHADSRDGKHKSALEHALAAMAVDPAHWGLVDRVARAHDALGNAQEAVAHFEKAISLTDSPEPRAALADLLQRTPVDA
jgi:tetratricopeptide (TPR) repeat protein